MDDADRAAPHIEDVVADGLADVRRAPTIPAIGICHYCAEPLEGDLRFCDANCRDGFEHEQKLKRMAGVK